MTLLATKVTISSNYFQRHDKGNLLGGNDIAGFIAGYGPGKIDVTFYGNYYQNMIQRMAAGAFRPVHVYNNVFDGDRRATAAEYRLGDTWATGTAAKLVTENNLFDILNDSNLTIPRIINYASTVANRDVCVSAGFTAAQCGTYYYDAGTWVTMRRANGTNTATTLFDAFAAENHPGEQRGQPAARQARPGRSRRVLVPDPDLQLHLGAGGVGRGARGVAHPGDRQRRRRNFESAIYLEIVMARRAGAMGFSP